MNKDRIRLIRYSAVVAAIYFIAFLGVVLLAGRAEIQSGTLPWRFWSLPFIAMALSVLFTLGVIARFGNAGGSLYFLTTVIHATLLIVLAFAVFRAL